MSSFTCAMDADTAFCGRPPAWQPEHSLSRDFGAKADEGRGFTIQVKGHGKYRQLTGYVGTKEVVSMSNHVDETWGVGSSSCLPFDGHEARKFMACYEAVFRKSFELMHSMSNEEAAGASS